jgi:hypothetical protein
VWVHADYVAVPRWMTSTRITSIQPCGTGFWCRTTRRCSRCTLGSGPLGCLRENRKVDRSSRNRVDVVGAARYCCRTQRPRPPFLTCAAPPAAYRPCARACARQSAQPSSR